ncbi:hypothetical protein, partial [Parabacteroides goldsteinii]|uniref:hypothetical protein n=1 Tax=Parabacteroides goldsteinii TaxID=328812 RepID=UPI00267117F1
YSALRLRRLRPVISFWYIFFLVNNSLQRIYIIAFNYLCFVQWGSRPLSFGYSPGERYVSV